MSGGGNTSSKGPSPDDPGLAGAFSGGGGSELPGFDPASIGNSPSFGSNSDYYFGAPNDVRAASSGPRFSFGSQFSASDGASPFSSSNVGGTANPASWNSSIANPSGTGPAGGSGTSAAGFAPPPGIGNAFPTDLTSSFDPSGASSPVISGPGSPAPSAGAAPSGGKSLLDSLGIKNPLSTAIGAGGLIYAMTQGQKSPKYSPELEAQAASLNAQGKELLGYLSSGNLPPGLKASLDQATAAAKAKAISNAAAQGLPTDPNQNTALAATLAAIDQQALISTAQIGQQLMQSGIAETGLSSDLYKTLSQIDQAQTDKIGKAIANFASAVSPSGGGGSGGGGINLKLG